MTNLLKAMANLMKKFKRKRRLSSELHSRWGDPSISYPTEGSWNQRDQNSGLPSTTHAEPCHRSQPDESRRYISIGDVPAHNIGRPNDLGPHSINTRDTSAGLPIPKGYFDENIRRQAERGRRPRARGLGIDSTRQGVGETQDNLDDESCDEEDEERDRVGDPGDARHRGYAEISRPSPQLDCDSYIDRSSRSPPLSVTARMRRISTQSSTTEPECSVAGTTSSKHTSYTAASSVSAPSLPPDTPRYAFNSMHPASDKRHAPRPRYQEPEPAVHHEMVPSYDELYG
ncbi:uncharacterized protein N7498_006570 [Penicillium cinerascens]|uniref:Uncharacterized protein n=1 Tax=Penicillium cinerascens TaxID=70096 RepID=A0A9W9MIR4_9EURO|nr:uncharacterized protein N7498_006570 [Penicillium cinerascens]KAJ5201907.1 hypothetical protein N7498_006570 [Penicillium cinerascens]